MRLFDTDLLGFGSYEALVDGFEWDIPERMNIASEIFDRWGDDRRRIALCVERSDGRRDVWSYWELIRLAKRYANFLVSLGVERGDRVSLVMPQSVEVAALHLAVYAVGATVLPMSSLYGPDSYRHILSNSNTGMIIVAEEYADRIRMVMDDLPDLETIVIFGQPGEGERSLSEAGSFPPDFDPVDTSYLDPAMLLYTSGSTGHPKGALHGHRIIEGYLLTFKLFFNVEFDESTVFYTPSDWAWVGGLLDILLPALVFGHPVVADQKRFSAERAFEVIARNGVTHAFLTPTALKMMAQVPDPASRFDLDLKVIAGGGESVADELHKWSERDLGAVINEFYGLTEVNHLVGGCEALWPGIPGWMGLPYPGRTVAVLDDDGNPIEPGDIGEIGVRPGDPTRMIEYWGNPEATAGSYRNGWIMTGDQGTIDAQGYIRFLGRDDDMVSSAGYRIGPAEVEESLVRHPQVAEVAVIPSPDPIRGQVVKAMVVLADGCVGGDDLTAELQAQVKTQLAAYKYPRVVEYVESLPKTTTGKLNRKLLASLERG